MKTVVSLDDKHPNINTFRAGDSEYSPSGNQGNQRHMPQNIYNSHGNFPNGNMYQQNPQPSYVQHGQSGYPNYQPWGYPVQQSVAPSYNQPNPVSTQTHNDAALKTQTERLNYMNKEEEARLFDSSETTPAN